MKDKEKNLIKIAEEIYAKQSQCQKKLNLENNLLDIERLAKNLTLEDLLFIDEYIQNNLTR